MSQSDNSLIQIFLPIFNAGLTTDGYTGVIVKQSNQPTMQGINTAPTLFFFKVSNRRYGFLGRYDYWNSVTSKFVHLEKQYIESTWQMSALVLQNPATPNQYTASDLVNEAASIIQSDYARDILNASNIGILRVSEFINPYFVDDRENFEASPSFDFTFTYENIRASTTPTIDSFTANFIGV